MRRGFAWRAAIGVLALGLAVTGCTTSTADDPTSTVTSSGPSASVVDTSPVASSSPLPSPSPSVIEVPTPSASPSLNPEAQELADRAAIEAQWVKFWDVYENIVRTPREDRAAALDSVAVDPMKGKVLAAASNFDAEGLDYYGAVTERPYWVDSIAGDLAVMRDCQDQSQYGSVYVSSGEKRTVGIDRNSLQAGFIRGPDRIWRVQNVQYLENVPC